jgi:diphthamide synthase subunit DPH2
MGQGEFMKNTLEKIKSKCKNPFMILFKNFEGNTARNMRSGKVTASEKNQKSKRVDPQLSWRDLQKKFNRQGQKCHWLGVKLKPDNNFYKYHPMAMSVDRVDSSKGYYYENIVISSRMANLGRGTYPANKYKYMCKKITKRLK